MTSSLKKTVWLHGTFGEAEAFNDAIPDPHQGLGFHLKKALKEAGYEIKITNDGKGLGRFTALIMHDMDRKVYDSLAPYPKERCLCIVTEPPAVRPEFYNPKMKERVGKIFMLLDNFVDNVTYFKIHHPLLQIYPIPKEQEVPFEKKKLCCMVQGGKFIRPDPGELYTERRDIAKYLTQLGEFDLWGNLWDGFPSWKGMAPLNKTVLKNYKFTFAIENTWNQPGYITERIFNSFYARNVPVYLGAPDILDYVPKECFIHVRDFTKGKRTFGTYQEIWKFMKAMNKSTYQKYIDAGQEYITNNPKLKLFGVENIVKTVMEQVQKLDS